MRVLWVEDFGGGSVAQSICDSVFSELLPKGLESLAKTQRPGKKRPSGYDEWRHWHESQRVPDEPEIDIYRHSRDIDALLESGFLVDRYDAILLDINLENDFFDSDSGPNPVEGGFWLYNKLVGAGYPSERIALLTAHSGENATTEFQATCLRQNHEKLLAFGKGSEAAGNWINDLANANSAFLRLRRGVLDGITFANELLNLHRDAAIRLNMYVGNNEKLTFDQALGYLHSMQHSLPLRVSSTKIDLQLRGLRDLLGHEWDRANPRFHEDSFYQSLGWVMKYLRNWSSHGHLLDKASVGDIAYLVLAGLRSSFLVPEMADDELRPYERHLLSAMAAENNDLTALSKRLSKSYLDARSLLWKRVGKKTRLPKKVKPWVVEDQEIYHEIVNELSGVATPLPRSTLDFPSALRELFIHTALSPTYPAISDADADNMQGIEAAYSAAWLTRAENLPEWVKATWARL